ncbi:MAG: glycosyltransferase [Phycisphaerae bacterium]|nr:glycosyltransferase [Phycisphaerae bacterium]MDP7287403.1 glycosyltransferase [Phycisphaerae bacterium]
MIRVSIVTPVFNNRCYVRQAIESILSQEGDFEIEHIIKDGGSTDGTLEILDEYAGHPSVKVITGPDRSLYHGLRIGYEHATGDIGGFLCSDDFYAEGAVAKVLAGFEKYPDRDWLYGRCDIVDGESKPIRSLITRYKNLAGFWYNRWLLGCVNYVNAPATFWRMRAWRALDGMTDKYKYASDYAFWMELGLLTKGIALHERVASFRRAGESISDLHFHDQFAEELEIARGHTGPLAYAIHKLNVWGITGVYSLLGRRRTAETKEERTSDTDEN